MIRPNNELIGEVVAEALEYVLNTETIPKKRKRGKAIPDSIRKKISSSDGKVCPLCGVSMIFTPARTTPLRNNEATWEHVLDLGLGGSNTLDNTAIICHSCNTAAAKLLTSYLGINGEVLGSIGWKNEFVKDKRNLFRLHKYLEWKMKAILLERIDGREGLGKLWTIARWGDPGDLRKGEARHVAKDIVAISVEKKEVSPLGKFVGWCSSLFGFWGKSRKREQKKNQGGEGERKAEVGTEKNVEFNFEDWSNPVDSRELGQSISQYQRKNGLEETGTMALLKAFGFQDSKNFLSFVMEEFSKNIQVESTDYSENDSGKMVPRAYKYRVKNPTGVSVLLVPSWSELNKSNKDDLEKLIISLIWNHKKDNSGEGSDTPEASIEVFGQPPDWDDLDKANKGDLAKLIISLIGGERMSTISLGKEISSYQRKHGLEEIGTKALIKAFGLGGRNMSLNKVIVKEFSEIIDVKATAFRTDELTGGSVPVAFEYRVKTSLVGLEEE